MFILKFIEQIYKIIQNQRKDSSKFDQPAGVQMVASRMNPYIYVFGVLLSQGIQKVENHSLLFWCLIISMPIQEDRINRIICHFSVLPPVGFWLRLSSYRRTLQRSLHTWLLRSLLRWQNLFMMWSIVTTMQSVCT